jgi:hypothetical protein
MARLRLCEPVPHDRVQVDQLSAKASYTQSEAHACVLQSRVSARCGHATPPSMGCVRLRLRLCEPVPHVMVHVDQATKVPTTQSSAQAKLLQERVSAVCAHATPPYKACVESRVRFCEP